MLNAGADDLGGDALHKTNGCFFEAKIYNSQHRKQGNYCYNLQTRKNYFI